MCFLLPDWQVAYSPRPPLREKNAPEKIDVVWRPYLEGPHIVLVEELQKYSCHSWNESHASSVKRPVLFPSKMYFLALLGFSAFPQYCSKWWLLLFAC